ncbi:MAG: iolG 2, partial [Verrucomicrobia bacterium]|nr:iolG 2 [Verrucomicrobiota bacterium]
MAAAATTGWSAQSWSQVAGANNAVRVGVVGLNGRGRDHLAILRKTPGVRIAALCDVDRQVLYRETNEAKKLGEAVKTFADVRELLASRDIDAITIATPNHWHALLTIWACQAGKDVYVEKPVSHNVWEGRQMVNAARKHGRVVQTGTQSRSSE